MAKAAAALTVRCSRCSADPGGQFFAACGSCGGLLEPLYDLTSVRERGRDWLKGQPHTIWGYADLLPQPVTFGQVSLGEGDTPLLLSEAHRHRLGRRLYLKNESINPTWSHKDRFQSVAATIARDLGYTGLAGTSTGNHGVAAAAYASAAGLRSLILYPPEMSSAFLHLTGLYGGQAAVAGWATRSKLLDRVLARPGWCPVDDRNPFGPEGYKTIAYEIVRDLEGAPEVCLVPVGSGRLIVGVWKGFAEMKAAGLVDSVPRMIACQAAGVGVVAAAMRDGEDDIPFDPDVQTVALSTRESTADRRVLAVLRQTQGLAVSVPEGSLAPGAHRLGLMGYAAEPASVLPMLAYELLVERDEVPRSAVAVAILTSSLTKTPELVPELSPRKPWRLGRDLGELEALLDLAERSSDAPS